MEHGKAWRRLYRYAILHTTICLIAENYINLIVNTRDDLDETYDIDEIRGAQPKTGAARGGVGSVDGAGARPP